MNPAYLAGLFDANGYLSIRQRTNKPSPYYTLKCAISNGDESLLKLIYLQYGGTIRHPSHGYVLEIYSRDKIRVLLTDIQPHVYSMATKIELWLRYLNDEIEADEVTRK